MANERFEFQVELENKERDERKTVTVRVEVDEHGRAHVRGADASGPDAFDGKDEDDKFEVSFVVRSRRGGNHCWVCLEEPCPPKRQTFVANCPFP